MDRQLFRRTGTFQVLATLDESTPKPVVEIADAVSVSTPTVYRIVSDLEDEDFIQSHTIERDDTKNMVGYTTTVTEATIDLSDVPLDVSFSSDCC